MLRVYQRVQATGFVANELIVQLLQSGYTVRGEAETRYGGLQPDQLTGRDLHGLFTCRHCEVTR